MKAFSCRRCVHLPWVHSSHALMRSIVIVFLDKLIKATLLLKEVEAGRFGRFKQQCNKQKFRPEPVCKCDSHTLSKYSLKTFFIHLKPNSLKHFSKHDFFGNQLLKDSILRRMLQMRNTKYPPRGGFPVRRGDCLEYQGSIFTFVLGHLCIRHPGRRFRRPKKVS